MEIDEVRIGDKLYIEDDDDCYGGLATIGWIGTWTNKRMWVSFMEIGEHAAFNLKHLIDHQEEFEEDYRGKTARLRD